MKVAIGKNLFRVRFHKRYKGTNKKRSIDTCCVISNEDPNKQGAERFSPFSSAIARHNYKDKYNKVLGKRKALDRAMDQFSHDERSKFWLAFEIEFADCK